MSRIIVWFRNVESMVEKKSGYETMTEIVQRRFMQSWCNFFLMHHNTLVNMGLNIVVGRMASHLMSVIKLKAPLLTYATVKRHPWLQEAQLWRCWRAWSRDGTAIDEEKLVY